MSQENYYGLAIRETMRTNPETLIIDEQKLSKQLGEVAKAQQALDVKNAAAKPSEPRKLYNSLRKELFDRQQWAKNAEIYCLTKADTVKHFEGRISDLITQKKAAVNNPLHERALEHQIDLLETELLDAKKEFNRAKHQSTNAARALRDFTGHQRIAELKLELGIA